MVFHQGCTDNTIPAVQRTESVCVLFACVPVWSCVCGCVWVCYRKAALPIMSSQGFYNYQGHKELWFKACGRGRKGLTVILASD